MDDGHDHNGFPDLLSVEAWEEVGDAYGLARQERRVLRLLCRGLGNVAIAAALGIRPPTLRTHLRSIYAKLGCAGRVAIVLKLVHGFQKDEPTHP